MLNILHCDVCGTTSDRTRFYRGVSRRCAECHKRLVKENRLSKVEYYREYDAKRFKEQPKMPM